MMKKLILIFLLVSLSGGLVFGQANDTTLKKRADQLTKRITLLGLRIDTAKNRAAKIQEGNHRDTYLSSIRKKLSVLSPIFLSLFLVLYTIIRLRKEDLNE